MPVILDNNFAKDTYGVRTERLIAIQGNFARYNDRCTFCVLNAIPLNRIV